MYTVSTALPQETRTSHSLMMAAILSVGLFIALAAYTVVHLSSDDCRLVSRYDGGKIVGEQKVCD